MSFHSQFLCYQIYSGFRFSGKNLKEGLVSLEENLLKLTDQLQQEAQCIPNTTHPDVPIGGEDCSIIRKMVFLPFRTLNYTFLPQPFWMVHFMPCNLFCRLVARGSSVFLLKIILNLGGSWTFLTLMLQLRYNPCSF